MAARTAAAVARIIDKFADLIKIAVKAAKLRRAVAVERITVKSKEILQRIRDLGTKLPEKLRGRVPARSFKYELADAETWKGGNLLTLNGPKNGYRVRRDADGNITNCSFYDADGVATKRVDLTGKPHLDKSTGEYIPTPQW